MLMSMPRKLGRGGAGVAVNGGVVGAAGKEGPGGSGSQIAVGCNTFGGSPKSGGRGFPRGVASG